MGLEKREEIVRHAELVTGLGERAEVGIYRAQSGTLWANWLVGNSWKERGVEDLRRTWRTWLPGGYILDWNGRNANPRGSQSRGRTQASKGTERYTGIGISCNLEGLGVCSSLEIWWWPELKMRREWEGKAQVYFRKYLWKPLLN